MFLKTRRRRHILRRRQESRAFLKSEVETYVLYMFLKKRCLCAIGKIVFSLKVGGEVKPAFP